MRQYGEPRRHHDAEGHRNEQSWPSPHDAQQQGRAVNLAVFGLHRPVVSRPLDTAIDRPSPDVIKAYASLSPNELCDVLELSCVIRFGEQAQFPHARRCWRGCAGVTISVAGAQSLQEERSKAR